MQELQNELRSAAPDINIEILAINRSDTADYNGLISSYGSLPSLQDTAMDNVWARWGVVYRDVWILDAENQLAGVYNLTANNLGVATNKAALKQMFLNAAKVVDSDGDRLPDFWEMRYLGNLTASANDYVFRDTVVAFAEFAFGTDPNSLRSTPRLIVSPSTAFNNGRFQFTYKRWAGDLAQFVVESSPDLKTWTPAQNASTNAPRNLFDGTGCAEARFVFPQTVAQRPAGFMRVRATPRPAP